MKTTKVKIWAVRQKKGRQRPTFEIRWVTDNEPHSRSRRTKALAEAFRADLIQATKRGEEFDVSTGLPPSMEEAAPEPEPEPVRAVLAVAQAYVAMRWPRAAPKSRDGITDALPTVLPALTRDQPGRPGNEQLRTALRQYALLPADRRPEPAPELITAIQWLETACLPIADLNEAKAIRPALDALTVNLDGTASAANTISRKRAVLYNFLEYAAELGELAANPLTKVKWTPRRPARPSTRASWSTRSRPITFWSA